MLREPDDNFRSRVAEMSRELREQDDTDAESGLADLLAEMYSYIRDGSDEGEITDREEAYRVLSSAVSWASIISHAVANVYAPLSPFPRRLAGWAKRVSSALLQVVGVLQSHMQAAVTYLQGQGLTVSFSIGIEFPVGVGVSLNFP